jgi:tol-pal system protein YbgF
MKNHFAPAALGLLVAGSLAGTPAPALAADKETRQMMADIRMLQEQSQLLQNVLGSLAEALKALNGRIDQQAESNRKSFADQKLTIDAVSGDLRVIRERMDDNNVRIGSLTQEVDALRQTVLQLNVAPAPAVPAGDPLDPSAAAPSAPAASPAPAPSIVGGMSPQRAFDMAKADYLIGQYELAISGLEGYVRTFPRSEQAGEAQALVGNSYLQLGKYDQAVEAYDLAIRTYPRSPSIPEAQYKKGTALQSLKQTDAARAAFEAVIKNYPDSPEATLAKQGLDGLALSGTRKP